MRCYDLRRDIIVAVTTEALLNGRARWSKLQESRVASSHDCEQHAGMVIKVEHDRTKIRGHEFLDDPYFRVQGRRRARQMTRTERPT